MCPHESAASIEPVAANLESTARRFAALDRADVETLIGGYVVQAIDRWRIDDAIFWQRVRFRSRMIRATLGVVR